MPGDPPLRGALIGCGFVSRHHLDAWNTFPDVTLAAVCDLRPERLDWAGEIVPKANRYRDAAEMLAAERPDFVEICTRPDVHRPLTGLAAASGTHVLCQKPAAETREDLLAMIGTCQAAGVRLMFHENWRFRPWYREMRRAIDDGLIGRPIRLRLSHRDWRAIRPDGFADQPFFAEMPRLILFEMGPHLVDAARFLLGEVAEVSATLGHFGAGHPGEDVATLSLRFASGALGLLDLSWCAPADVSRPEWALNETVVEGTEGALRVLPTGSLRLDLPDGRARGLGVYLPPEDRVYLDAYIAAQRHFLAGLRDPSFPYETGGPETLRTMDVVWAGYRSAAEGRVVRLDRSGSDVR